MDAKSAYLYIMKLKIQYGACLTDVYHWLSAIYEIHGIIDINEIYAESIQGVSAYPYVRQVEWKKVYWIQIDSSLKYLYKYEIRLTQNTISNIFALK